MTFKPMTFKNIYSEVKKKKKDPRKRNASTRPFCGHVLKTHLKPFAKDYEKIVRWHFKMTVENKYHFI